MQGAAIAKSTALITTSKEQNIGGEDEEQDLAELEDFRPRMPSNASNRSSGYYSIRGSDARLSQHIMSDLEEKDESSETSLAKDERVIMNSKVHAGSFETVPQCGGESILPVFRPRCYQVKYTMPRQHNKKQLHCDDLSKSLPTTYRQDTSTNLTSASSSSSSSLDSETTLESSSESEGGGEPIRQEGKLRHDRFQILMIISVKLIWLEERSKCITNLHL